MDGDAVISHDVLASYAADAALEIAGVGELVDGPRRHRGVRVTEDDGALTVEIHVALDWGARAPETGAAVHARLRRGKAGASTGISSFVAEALRAVPDGVAVRARFDSGFYSGAFATTFIGYDFTTFLARLNSGEDISCPSQGVPNSTPCTFDANFDSVASPEVPEPATLLLLGTGLLGAGYRQRRKLSKK